MLHCTSDNAGIAKSLDFHAEGPGRGAAETTHTIKTVSLVISIRELQEMCPKDYEFTGVAGNVFAVGDSDQGVEDATASFNFFAMPPQDRASK